jgi:DNA-binding NarL/FixJ family response regulator
VLVVDDHQLVIDAVTVMVERDGEFEVVGTATSGRDICTLVARTEPDVVLLDVCLPAPDGIACLEALQQRHPRTSVVVLSGLDEGHIVREALERGASAFVRKDVDPRDLVGILRQVLEGTVVSRDAANGNGRDEKEAAQGLLTKAELAVLESLAQGRGNKQIAADLSIAQQTVKFHLTNIYRKLGVTNRTEAIRYAYEHRLVQARSWALTPAAAH